MKVIYSYMSTIGQKAISIKEFVDINRISEALKYLYALRFNANMSNIFNDSVEDAIETTTLSDDLIRANASDFYGALSENLFEIVARVLGKSVQFEDLSAIEWWKVVTFIPDDNDPEFVTEKVTIERINNPKEEVLSLLMDLEL